MVLAIAEGTAEFHVRNIALAIPQLVEEECELTPYQRVLVWAFWRFHPEPSEGQTTA